MPNNSRWRAGRLQGRQGQLQPALGSSAASTCETTPTPGTPISCAGRSAVDSPYDAERIALVDGGLQSAVVLGRLLELRTNSGEQLNAHYSATEEVVTDPFVIYEDRTRRVVVPPGTYSFGEKVLSVQTGGQRTFSGGVSYRSGDFYDGVRENIGGQFAWKQSRRFALGLRYDLNDIVLPQAFVTRLLRLTTEPLSSTLLGESVQHDNVSEVAGVNTRLRWIPKAGRRASSS
jgi:hypothetical protein